MSKIVLNWKAPSIKQITDFVSTLTDDEKKDFAHACFEKRDGKSHVIASKAKKWLVEKYDKTGEIEWKNRPTNSRPMSSADIVASWLDL